MVRNEMNPHLTTLNDPYLLFGVTQSFFHITYIAFCSDKTTVDEEKLNLVKRLFVLLPMIQTKVLLLE